MFLLWPTNPLRPLRNCQDRRDEDQAFHLPPWRLAPRICLNICSNIRWLINVTLWLFNIAMENGPFIDDFPIKTSIYEGFSIAMLNNQMVIIIVPIKCPV
jgi:hypothetical protein